MKIDGKELARTHSQQKMLSEKSDDIESNNEMGVHDGDIPHLMAMESMMDAFKSKDPHKAHEAMMKYAQAVDKPKEGKK